MASRGKKYSRKIVSSIRETNKSIGSTDLAAIHKLLDCEDYSTPDPAICPGCNMPFDKGKKRKLIDTCGHERCYSCMFRNEACPLCTANDPGNFENYVMNILISHLMRRGDTMKSIPFRTMLFKC